MIFLDSSPLLAVLLNTEESDRCEAVLSGIEIGEAKAVTTSHVLEETGFKLIFAKASEALQTRNVWRIREELKMNEALRQKCRKVLDDFMGYVRVLCFGGLQITEITGEDVFTMIEIFGETGLLTADCLHIAVMRRLNLKKIVTLDEDFKKVKNLVAIP